MLYEEWKRIFGIVYGQELVKAQQDANALARLYHVTESTDLKPLLFAVHTYYALLMKLLAAELLSLQQGALMASVMEQLPALPGEQLRGRLGELEKGRGSSPRASATSWRGTSLAGMSEFGIQI